MGQGSQRVNPSGKETGPKSEMEPTRNMLSSISYSTPAYSRSGKSKAYPGKAKTKRKTTNRESTRQQGHRIPVTPNPVLRMISAKEFVTSAKPEMRTPKKSPVASQMMTVSCFLTCSFPSAAVAQKHNRVSLQQNLFLKSQA